MNQRKVCLVGDFAVGKTSLFSKYIYNRFSSEYLTTIGVRVQRRTITAHGQELALVLWDTEGSDTQPMLRPGYVAGAAAVIIVCDLMRVNTILHCLQYASLVQALQPVPFVAIAANKKDLVSADHPHLTVVQRVARTARAHLVLTSASTGEGVEPLFQQIGEEITRA